MSEGEFEVAADFALRCARPVNERSLVKLLVAEARRAREAEARWMHAYQDASDGTTEARADKAEAHAKELYEEQLDAAKRYKQEIDEETKRADEAEADFRAASEALRDADRDRKKAEAERDAARNALDVPDIALKAIANHAETLKEAKQIARAALAGMKGEG